MSVIVPGLNPVDFSDVYDYLIVNDTIVSPGQCTISGLKREEAWDVKDGNGQNGASITRKGSKLAKFTATFQLVLDPVLGIDDYAKWDDFLPVLKSCTAGKNPVALTVYHPDVAEADVDSVVVESIGQKVHDGSGGATVAVSFIEYKPPKKAGGSPKKGPDPNADLKKQVDDLAKEAALP